MGKGMHGGDCEEREAGNGLWENRYGEWTGEGTEGEGMQGGDCGERDAGRGLWGKGCSEGTVGKEMWGGD